MVFEYFITTVTVLLFAVPSFSVEVGTLDQLSNNAYDFIIVGGALLDETESVSVSFWAQVELPVVSSPIGSQKIQRFRCLSLKMAHRDSLPPMSLNPSAYP